LAAPRAPPHVDYLLSQQQAMIELQQVPRPPILQRCRSLGERRDTSHRASLIYYTPCFLDEPEALPISKEDPLLQQRSMETKKVNRTRACYPSWRKIVKWLALALFKRGRSRVEPASC
jgi:hypothetical protein